MNSAEANTLPAAGLDTAPRILVIRSGAIGDTLMATPLIRSLRTSFPTAYIAALASENAFDVLRFNPHLDDVFGLKRRHLPIFLSREKRRLISYLREGGVKTVLSLESHADFTRLACEIGEPGRIVTYDPKSKCDGIVLSPAEGEHSAELHLRAGSAIGANQTGLETEFHYPRELDRAIADRLASHGIEPDDLLIGVHAGWGGRRQNPEDTRLRSWPASRFAELIRRLAATFPAKFVLTGSRLDRDLNAVIARDAGIPVIDAAGGFSLLESAALITRLDLYITIDSGPAHIAAAVGTPLITLWGPGIFTATRPLPGRAEVRVVRDPPLCAPCYGTDLMRSCSDNVCMKNIGVERVVCEATNLMEKD